MGYADLYRAFRVFCLLNLFSFFGLGWACSGCLPISEAQRMAGAKTSTVTCLPHARRQPSSYRRACRMRWCVFCHPDCSEAFFHMNQLTIPIRPAVHACVFPQGASVTIIWLPTDCELGSYLRPVLRYVSPHCLRSLGHFTPTRHGPGRHRIAYSWPRTA